MAVNAADVSKVIKLVGSEK